MYLCSLNPKRDTDRYVAVITSVICACHLLQCLSSEPKHAIMFCNFEMTEFRCRAKSRHNNDAGVSSDARPVRKTRVQLISVEAYMKQVLPTECAIHGTVTDGVIGKIVLLDETLLS